jgi:hypothetical protein
MTIQERGRIDWKPRLSVWRVIWYQGSRDVPSGDYITQAEAIAALRAKIDALHS